MPSKLTERNDEIVKAYEVAEASGHVSFTDLGHRFGLTGRQIRNILVGRGIDAISTAPRGRKPTRNASARSVLHRVIGARISNHCAEREINISDYARSINLSPASVGSMVVGTFDYTLSDLQTLAQDMGISVSELVKDV